MKKKLYLIWENINCVDIIYDNFFFSRILAGPFKIIQIEEGMIRNDYFSQVIKIWILYKHIKVSTKHKVIGNYASSLY